MKLLLKTICFALIILIVCIIGITIIGLLPLMMIQDEIGEFLRIIKNY